MRQNVRRLEGVGKGFNPRTPCGVRPDFLVWTGYCRRFQSTHSLRSATARKAFNVDDDAVSIHALLAECDIIKSVKLKPPTSFNPRTPCGVRRAGILSLVLFAEFQSTHSLRSATAHSTWEIVLHRVSIHALLAECDTKPLMSALVIRRFNPRTPCGVRRLHDRFNHPRAGFQSTHSLRSATAGESPPHNPLKVSIHALLAECDIMNNKIELNAGVSIHALLAECDKPLTPVAVHGTEFQSTHSLRSATSEKARPFIIIWGFNPRTPCGVRPTASR